MLHKRIRFRGEEYWLHESDYCDGLISPIDHYSESGELEANPFIDISFAVVEGNNIMRFGDKIGDISEIEEVNVKTTEPPSQTEEA